MLITVKYKEILTLNNEFLNDIFILVNEYSSIAINKVNGNILC